MWDTIKQKLSSRKFLVAVFNALFIILNEGLELGVPSDVYAYITAILIAWILGESYVDSKR